MESFVISMEIFPFSRKKLLKLVIQADPAIFGSICLSAEFEKSMIQEGRIRFPGLTVDEIDNTAVLPGHFPDDRIGACLFFRLLNTCGIIVLTSTQKKNDNT